MLSIQVPIMPTRKLLAPCSLRERARGFLRRRTLCVVHSEERRCECWTDLSCLEGPLGSRSRIEDPGS